MAKPSTSSSRWSSALAIVIAIMSTIGLSALLFANAAVDSFDQPDPARTVATARYDITESYQRQSPYLGLVVSANQSELGFEVPGRIEQAPPREGTEVSAGDVLAKLDTRTLQSRRNALAGQLEQVQAQRQLAQIQAKRQRKLVSTGAVSKQLADQSRLQAKALVANEKSVAAQLQGVDLELEKAVLVAPFNGTVANRYRAKGAVVAAGSPIIGLIQNNEREVHVGVPSAQLKNLIVGASYPVVIGDKELNLPLLAVRADVDARTRAVSAVFGLSDQHTMLSGEPATLLLPETITATGGWLPLSALLEGERGLWNVLRVNSDGDTFYTEREIVEVLELDGERVYVRGTLGNGAQIVASGVHRITPGAQVRIADQEEP